MILRYYSPSGVEIEFSSTSETYKLLKGYAGFGTPPVSHITSRAYGQDGKTLDDTRFEPRVITLDVMMTAPTLGDLKYAGRLLSTVLNPLAGEGTLVVEDDDGEEFSIACIGNSSPTTPSTQKRSTYQQQLTVNLIAHDPMWNTYPSNITSFGAGTPVTFPFSLPWMFPSSSPSHVLTNTGNVAAPVEIILTGAIQNPTITRAYTLPNGSTVSEALGFTLTMDAGDVLTINTGFNNKTITLWDNSESAYVSNPFQYLNADPVFWQLVPGDNTVTLTDVSIDTATAMTVEYTDRLTAIYV